MKRFLIVSLTVVLSGYGMHEPGEGDNTAFYCITGDHHDAKNYFEMDVTELKKLRQNNRNHLLRLAASLGDEKFTTKLLEAGADHNAKCIEGKTALYYAEKNQHKNIVKILSAHKLKKRVNK